jgi:nucleotide-binding universal stress UspA family protein
MLRKILIAVDGSIHSKGALAYVAGVFAYEPEVQFTIINVQPILSQYLTEEARTNSKACAELQRVMQRQTVESNELLDGARAQFVRMGIEAGHINMVSQVRMQGQAKDIIDYAHKYLYDAIVVGRRGLSRVQKAFMGSTSAKIVEHAASVPVWIVDGDVQARGILAAVDTSAASLQMVDYLGVMLRNQPNIRMTFYHVDESPGMPDAGADRLGETLSEIIAKGERQRQDQFWKVAKERLETSGISANRVELMTRPRTGRIAKMILEQTQSGDFDTVVLGRRGTGNAFFLGGVAHYVIERLTDRAVWLIG